MLVERDVDEEVSGCTKARISAGSLPVGAPGFAVVTSVGEAHGRTRDLLNPMPTPCAHGRSWTLVYGGMGSLNAGRQQPTAVGVGTDADTAAQGRASPRSQWRAALLSCVFLGLLSLRP